TLRPFAFVAALPLPSPVNVTGTKSPLSHPTPHVAARSLATSAPAFEVPLGPKSQDIQGRCDPNQITTIGVRTTRSVSPIMSLAPPTAAPKHYNRISILLSACAARLDGSLSNARFLAEPTRIEPSRKDGLTPADFYAT